MKIFEEFGHEAYYYIETKHPEENPEMTKELIRVLNEYDLIANPEPEGKVIIQSISEESLREIHGIEPSLPYLLFNFSHLQMKQK